MAIEVIYKKEDIFSNVDEVRARMGWKEGDVLVFSILEEGGFEIRKKEVE